MTKFLYDRDRYLPTERICDLKYSDIRRDPMNAVRYIYDYFGWPLAHDAEKRIRNGLAKQPPEQNGFHRYGASQFRLETMDRERDFGAYCTRFGLSRHAASESTPPANALVSK